MSSRTSSRRSSTAANCNGSPRPPSRRPVNAFPASRARPPTTTRADARSRPLRAHPAANTFSTAEIYPHVIAALARTSQQYRLSSLLHDVSKLRAKSLVEKLPRSRRYRLPPRGTLCVIFLKLFERVYAPSRPGFSSPSPATRPSRTRNAPISTASVSVSRTPSAISSPPSASNSLHPSTRTNPREASITAKGRSGASDHALFSDMNDELKSRQKFIGL
jgi:hypothetical protein